MHLPYPTKLLVSVMHQLLWQIDEKSRLQGFSNSRLPEFSPEEILEIRNSSDFLGINHYTAEIVSPKPVDKNESVTNVNYWKDSDTEGYQEKSWYA